MAENLVDLLGAESDSLLQHRCSGIPVETLHLPGPDSVDSLTKRPRRVVRSEVSRSSSVSNSMLLVAVMGAALIARQEVN